MRTGLMPKGLDGADHPETSIMIESQNLCRNDFAVVCRQIDIIRFQDEIPDCKRQSIGINNDGMTLAFGSERP